MLLLVVVGPHVSGILDLLRLWWDGKLPDDQVVGGFPMVWVARFGKGLQIAAGMVVVVDLLTANWLARWANHASVRAKQRGIIVRHHIWIYKIRQDLVHVVAYGPSSKREYLRYSPPDKVPRGLPLTLAAYRDFHRDVVKQVEREHSCDGQSHPAMCIAQSKLVDHCIDELAMGRIAASERAAVADYYHHLGGREFFPWLITFSIALPLWIGVVAASLLSWEWLAQDRDLLFVSVLLLGVLPPVAISFIAVHPLVQLKWYQLHKVLADFLVEQAKKSPPFRAAKLFALGVFLVGAALDLLAS
ncbi:hypothetical protein V6U90_21570 [Micromonospora sp. CPCC 206060]|uniref:hypothetical protein n=1 Tax=Micromonospora sp. CPCC 206060 TaxID=3122406 RepID=UPI002FEED069